MKEQGKLDKELEAEIVGRLAAYEDILVTLLAQQIDTQLETLTSGQYINTRDYLESLGWNKDEGFRMAADVIRHKLQVEYGIHLNT